MQQIINQTSLTEIEAQEELKKNYGKAEKILKSEDKFEKFMRKLEKKIEGLPMGASVLSYIPTMGSLVNAYVKRKYTEVPVGTIIAIVAALIYYIAPTDVIPDSIPVIGKIDDIGVIATCLPLIKKDLDDYVLWRELEGFKK